MLLKPAQVVVNHLLQEGRDEFVVVSSEALGAPKLRELREAAVIAARLCSRDE